MDMLASVKTPRVTTCVNSTNRERCVPSKQGKGLKR